MILFFYRVEMSTESEVESSSSIPLQMDLTIRKSDNTLSLFHDSVYNDTHNALEIHLMENQVEQHILDSCLMSGFRIVERGDRELSEVAPTLQLLLMCHAQWKGDPFLGHVVTPYHLICQSNGDHHELLDLMFIASREALIDTEDWHGNTAIWYAVINANINCVKSLIEGKSTHTPSIYRLLIAAIALLSPDSEVSQSIMTDIFDLLLDCSEYIESLSKTIDFAINACNVECVMKLFHLNARPNEKAYEWARAGSVGSVELLKCMLNHGIDKNCTDRHGVSLLTWAVKSGKVEAVRYLLDIGVTVTTYTSKPELQLCNECGQNQLLLNVKLFGRRVDDSCTEAIKLDMPEMVEMLVEHGGQSYNNFNTLALAVRECSVKVVDYLLNKYRYPLNIGYIWENSFSHRYRTLITEVTEPACRLKEKSISMAKLLLAHGADPNKICGECSPSPLITAICQSHEEIIAQFIRNGVDINFRSHDNHPYGKMLPFEVSVRNDLLLVTEMLLVSGCSCGVFSLSDNHESNNYIGSDVQDLMKKWNVHENNVIPLKQQCRRAILNYLSPQADEKITKLPLPPSLITYLSIPELDDILDACKDRADYYYCGDDCW